MNEDQQPPSVPDVGIPVIPTITELPQSQSIMLPRENTNHFGPDRLQQAYSESQITDEVARTQEGYKYKICGHAKISEDGEIVVCRRKAGTMTLHKGEGYCSHHDGRVPHKSGLYSQYIGHFPTLQSIFEETQARDSQLKGLNEEVGLARSVLAQFLEELTPIDKIGKTTEEVIKMEADRISAISRILTVIEAIRKLVETHASVSQKNQMTVTFEGFNMAIWCIQRIISEEVTDTGMQAKIFLRLASEVRLTTLPGQS